MPRGKQKEKEVEEVVAVEEEAQEVQEESNVGPSPIAKLEVCN